MKKKYGQCSPASKAWLALGGLLAVGVTIMIIKELPALRRELQILKM